MRYLAATIILSALVAMYLGIATLDYVATREAQIFELEVQVADLWKDNQDCKRQMGVFYRPRKEEKDGHGG